MAANGELVFIATSAEKGITIQHGDFKDCVVPEWRISKGTC